MFDAVRNNPRIVQIFLALIALPFAFWGVDSYLRSNGAGNDLASVGNSKISSLQFDQALRERQDQLRQSLGAEFKSEMMNSPAVKLGILNGLINQRLLLLEAEKLHLGTSNQALREVIGGIPAFQEDGKFSDNRYQAVLASQGTSPAQFEARIRQDLTLQQLVGTIGGSAFVSKTQAEQMLHLQAEERQFGEFRFTAASFADKVKIEPETVQKYYDENKQRFETPERIKANYVVLSLDTLLDQVNVNDAEIKKWYDDHPQLYRVPEERRASHILIIFDGDDKAKAKAQAETVYKEVQKNPSRFAELAKQYSKDPGSAQKGGDLGFFSRGMMVKPFDDAVFSLKDGEISGIVESDFGHHIIKLTGIQSERVRPLSDVRAEIESELKRQAASRRFAEAAEAFSNMVYEQSDSLQPVADKFGLKVQQTGWLPKNADAQTLASIGRLGNEKLLTALFSDDAVKEKRNTEAVEIAANTLVAARVAEHEPAKVRPLEAVRSDIEKQLKAEAAMQQARQAGEARLAELRKGDDKTAWSKSASVSRLEAGKSKLPWAALQAIFKADVHKLPAYVGVDVDDAYALFKITKVTQPEKIDEAQIAALKSEYTKVVAQEDLAAYLSGLRSRYEIDVNRSLLEGRDR